MRLFADLRYACRTIVHNPGFALIAIVSIALGVGLNAAIFSYVDSLLLRPLPVADSGRVVAVASTAPDTRVGAMSYPDFKDLRDQTQSLSALTCYQLSSMGVSVGRDEVAEMNLGVIASGNFFSGLEIEIADRPRISSGGRHHAGPRPGGRDQPLVVGTEVRIGPERGIGRKLRLNGAEFTVIGVAPAGFTGPEAFIHAGRLRSA